LHLLPEKKAISLQAASRFFYPIKLCTSYLNPRKLKYYLPYFDLF